MTSGASRAMRAALPAAALAVALALPDPGAACAVCTGGTSDEVRYAFLWTTGFLSVLPVGAVGILVWYLRRRARELAAKHELPAEAALSRSSASR